MTRIKQICEEYQMRDKMKMCKKLHPTLGKNATISANEGVKAEPMLL